MKKIFQGPFNPVLMEIVAELTYNHFGSIARAKKMIVAAKNAGATCVKFEMRNNGYYFRNNPLIMTRKDRYEFNDKQIKEFAEFCHKINIGWFASIHDIHSLKRIMRFQPRYIKIASREARLSKFLNHVKKINNKSFPVIISTGGLSFQQITGIYNRMKDEILILLHASCLYPCNDATLNMNRIIRMMQQFKCKIGYSGHERGFVASLYAITLGVDYIERHFTLEENHRKVAKGYAHFKDEECTLSPSEFNNLSEAIRKIIAFKKQRVHLNCSAQESKRVNYYGIPHWDGNDVTLLKNHR